MTGSGDVAGPGDGPAADNRPAALQTQRMEAFSDGVFAIAITLLVLEIQIPSGRDEDLLRAVTEEWAAYLAYLVSFSTIGGVWIAHTAITNVLDRADSVLLRINLVLLLVVAFVPLPTTLLSEYLQSADGERVAATLYGLVLLALRLLVLALWRYASTRRLLQPNLSAEAVRNVSERLTPSLVSYVVAIGVALVLPTVAVGLYLAIAVYMLVPVGAVARAVRRGRAGTG